VRLSTIVPRKCTIPPASTKKAALLMVRSVKHQWTKAGADPGNCMRSGSRKSHAPLLSRPVGAM
jgi:hypothetical protein